MIHLIEAKNFRSLRYVKQKLDRFQVLIGANASGKTTFLDVVGFISDIVAYGLDFAIQRRASNLADLTHLGLGGDIELALEVLLPEDVKKRLFNEDFKYIRYEIKIGVQDVTGEYAILEEAGFLLKDKAIKDSEKEKERLLFPEYFSSPPTILGQGKYKVGRYRRVFSKKRNGNDNFYSESSQQTGKGWMPSFKFGIKKTALGNLPADDAKFPASTWLKEFLLSGIHVLILDSMNIRMPSLPGQGQRFKPDGSNLPWVVDELKKDKKRFFLWLDHVRTALPDVEDIEVIERPEDKCKYIRVIYANGGKIPSWLVSDGTLRLLALTILAYLPNLTGVFLIEEPENGIHPKAIETCYQSLSSVYAAQILLASHSPVVLGQVIPKQVLCFAKTDDGATDIVNGADHPNLKEWRHEISLSDLFAGGILG